MMNRALLKSTLAAGVLVVAAAAAAQSQAPSFPPNGWILGPCFNPTSTSVPYSSPYGIEADWNDLFGAEMGVVGTGSFDYMCYNPSISGSTVGHFGEYTGPIGSAQDNVYPIDKPAPQYLDSWLYMVMGGWDAVCGNWGYADTVEISGASTGGTGGTTTRTPFGKNAVDTAYYGASGRYYVCESTNGDIRVIVRTDILGDGCKLTWQLINTTKASIQIGLDAGQWVRFYQGTLAYLGLSEGPVFQGNTEVTPWVNAPGYKPVIVDTRFAANPATAAVPNSTIPTPNAMPAYVNFGMTQQNAYGLDIPTIPGPGAPDQTPIDILDVGKSDFLLGLDDKNDEPMPAWNGGDVLLNDTTFTFDCGYVERYLPQAVEAGGTRTINMYYKSTWSSADLNPPYNVVVDAPNLVPLDSAQATPSVTTISPGDINQLATSPMIIRVYVDNTGNPGFSEVNQGVPLEDVQVTVNLPQGLVDANDGVSTTLTQYIPIVPPTTHTITNGYPVNTPMSYVDFEVVVDPGSLLEKAIAQQSQWPNQFPPPQAIAGQYNYQVTVVPNPGPTKTLTGTINIASRPNLNVSNSANLVGVPWSFQDNSWATIFSANSNPDIPDSPYASQNQLVLNQDFQAYGWDPLQQAYVGSSGPQRGVGYWLLMSPTVLAANLAAPTTYQLADRNLQAGTPSEPDLGNTTTSVPVLVDIQPGWNLIANPYDYGIPIGNLVGVSAANSNQTYTYSELATQNLVSPTMAFWDPNDQNYQFTQNFSDLMQPNTGYWVYNYSPQKITLTFPPVTSPFLPGTTEQIFLKRSNQGMTSMPAATWKLNLAVQSGSTVDRRNYVGVVSNPALTRMAAIMKPPVAPLAKALSAAVVQSSGGKSTLLAQSLVPNASKISWNWQVYSRAGGNTTVTWPNMASVPSNIDILLVDTADKKTIDMRDETSYSYSAKANANHQFTIQVAPYTGAILGAVSAKLSGSNKTSPYNIDYALDVAATTTIRVLKGTQIVATVTSGKSDAAGSHTVQWNQKNSSGQLVGTGLYSIQVTATIPGRSDVKSAVVLITR